MGLITLDCSRILIAFVAQLGERMTEDHKVRGSIPRGGTFLFSSYFFIIPSKICYMTKSQ